MQDKLGELKLRIKYWLEDSDNKLFLAVFIFAVIIRLYFFIMTKSQPVWWDAADYLSQAKFFGGKLSFDYFFDPHRPFLLALLWGGMYRLGLSEVSFRFTEFLFSIIAIPAVYLVAKQLSSKKVAIITSFLLAVFWQHLFFSNRLMTEIPTLTLFLFSVYFFIKAYRENKTKDFVLFGIFLGLAFLARAGTLVMFAVFPIFLIFTEKLNFLKNKKWWAGLLIILLIMSTFFIFIYFKNGTNPVATFLSLTPETDTLGGEGRFSSVMGFSGILEYLDFFPDYFGITLLVCFIFGFILVASNTFIGFDLILKNKSQKIKNHFFILVWALVPFLFQSLFANHMEPRYLLMSFPPFFIMLSIGLKKIYSWIKKYKKALAIFVIVFILSIGTYYQISQASYMITLKSTSYEEVKEAGLWIKENSEMGDIVFTISVPQTTYYSERKTYTIDSNQTIFEEQIEEYRPTFLILSLFESHEDWMYNYPSEHSDILTPVQAYTQEDQPVLIIYEFNYGEK